tara:strand:- start:401 stop:1078 length:678 start_codon:yes stop_codon:yes gene_type:complete
MVRALLAGRKTQTRRLLSLSKYRGMTKFGPSNTAGFDWHFRRADQCWCDIRDDRLRELLPHSAADRLYVREAWRPHYLGDGVWDLDVSYAADGERRRIMDGEFEENDWSWPKAADRGNVPSIHMPRWASRLTLTVTDVRVQRVQEIDGADAEAEGCVWDSADGHDVWYVPGAQTPRNGATAAECFSILWDSLHTKPGTRWDDNPWVYALTFDATMGNIGQIEREP